MALDSQLPVVLDTDSNDEIMLVDDVDTADKLGGAFEGDRYSQKSNGDILSLYNNPDEDFNTNFEMYGFYGSTEIGLMKREEVHQDRMDSIHSVQASPKRARKSNSESTCARIGELV